MSTVNSPHDFLILWDHVSNWDQIFFAGFFVWHPFGSFATILSVILCIYESMVHDKKESSNFVFGTCVLHVSNWNLAVAKINCCKTSPKQLDKCFTRLDLAPKVSCSFLTDASVISRL